MNRGDVLKKMKRQEVVTTLWVNLRSMTYPAWVNLFSISIKFS